jgi:hypothetical protein
MANKSLYVGNDVDEGTWNAGAAKARACGLSMGSYVLRLIRKDLDTELGEITVEVADEHQGVRKVRFLGRWLVDPELQTDDSERTRDDNAGHGIERFGWERPNESPEQWRVGVALTVRGRFAVYLRHRNYHSETARLETFHSLAAARAAYAGDARVPAEVFDKAGSELSGDVTLLDI